MLRSLQGVRRSRTPFRRKEFDDPVGPAHATACSSGKNCTQPFGLRQVPDTVCGRELAGESAAAP
jgi:hypothetical protein